MSFSRVQTRQEHSEENLEVQERSESGGQRPVLRAPETENSTEQHSSLQWRSSPPALSRGTSF